MPVSIEQIRAARVFLGLTQAELAAKSRCSRSTITALETGLSPVSARIQEDLIEALEDAGIVFYEAIPGERGPAVGLKWGVAPKARQPGEGTAAGEAGEGGLKAAWDDIEEAELDALLGEAPEPNPDMAEMWQADPELWARLSEGGRETLSRAMFGDRRAAGAGYFRSAEMKVNYLQQSWRFEWEPLEAVWVTWTCQTG